MDLALVVLVVSAMLFTTACGVDNRSNKKCATKLTYVTNSKTSGEQAIKEASTYQANFLIGKDNFSTTAIIDTASANLIINEGDFDHTASTTTGTRSYLFDNGDYNSMAINAKDNVDIACVDNFATRFSVTDHKYYTPNILGLGFRNPKDRPHENQNASFIEQLVAHEELDDVFSLALCGQKKSSRLLLGGVEEHMKPLLGNFIPIIEKSNYVVPALSIRRSDNKKNLGTFPIYDPKNNSGTKTIIDSASSFMLLPTDIALNLAEEVKNQARALGLLGSFVDGYFRTERANSTKLARFSSLEQIRQFPSFELIFYGTDGKNIPLELSPLHYFKEMDTNDSLWRTFAIRETNKEIILGQPFLENHYTYFDRKNSRIGFADIDIACSY